MLLMPFGDACLVGRLNWHETLTKVVAVVFFLLALSCSGYAQVVTAVEGESWLEHLHRSFDETSMGKSSGIYGPAAPMPSEWPLPHPTLKLSNTFTEQSTTLSGSDLYRLKCQGCHGSSGAGDPIAALVLCGAHAADRVMVGGAWRVTDGAPAGVDLVALRREHGAAAAAFARAM